MDRGFVIFDQATPTHHFMRTLYTLLLSALFCSTGFSQSLRDWGTYYGGTNEDKGTCVATDAAGNVYLAGYTASTSSIASGGFQNTYGGGNLDAFLVKLDPLGNRLWATYYGGNNDDRAYGVAVDPWGNVYISGKTLSASGISSNGFQNTFGGITDAFLVKFDASGNRIWATYYGGTQDEQGSFVTTDTSGNVYLAGYTGSYSGIASSGGFQVNNFSGYDAYVAKFDSSGARAWGTYYGGSGYDYGLGVAVDLNGNVFLSGYTASNTNIGSGGHQNTLVGSNNAFLVKFDSAGNRIWGTYYGQLSDGAYGVTTDASGNVYITGFAQSTTGIASGGFQNSISGSMDAFLVKFDAAGTRLWATYYGGPANELGFALDVDVYGNVFLSGRTYSGSNITWNGFQNIYGGGTGDAFLVGFDPTGNRLRATYYGGAGAEDDVNMIALDGYGSIYLTSYADTTTTSAIASGGFQNTFGGGATDGFLVKFSADITTGLPGTISESNSTLYPNPVNENATLIFENANSDICTFTLYDAQGQAVRTTTGIATDRIDIERKDLAAGIYFYRVTAADEIRASGKLIME